MTRQKTTTSLASLGRTSTRGRPGIPDHAAIYYFMGRPMPDFGTGLPCQDRDVDPDLFFPGGTQAEPMGSRMIEAQITVAKALCAACPAIQACADWAITHGEPHGVWGGLTPSERQQLRGRGGAA